jgi:hypothetical protein
VVLHGKKRIEVGCSFLMSLRRIGFREIGNDVFPWSISKEPVGVFFGFLDIALFISVQNAGIAILIGWLRLQIKKNV